VRPFAYRRAQDEQAAVEAAAQAGATFIAGGTELMQLWKAGIATPELVIDIGRLRLDQICARHGVIAVGALARLREVADHPLIQKHCPAITEAILASASPQIRNAATVGGNLLQRTRCGYFRGEELPCNKRRPGSGCGAREGENRLHAIFGASAHCVAVHASDLAVVLVALDASVRVRSSTGERVLSVNDLFALPGDTPQRDTVLTPHELITAIEVPQTTWARRSRYVKVRDRAAFEFALVSAAVALEVEDGLIKTARVAAGGVGTKPWRLTASENVLVGAPFVESTFFAAAARAADGAQALSQNGFKLTLLRRTVLRALREA
jgi:xanthine dehydrogenase YagS FAD-binding subunit